MFKTNFKQLHVQYIYLHTTCTALKYVNFS